MTTDTDALLTTVRDFIEDVPQYGTPEKPWASELPNSQPAADALDSLAAELERAKEATDALREVTTAEFSAMYQKWERTDAELERVKAERDAMKTTAYFQDFARKILAAEARLDKALSALREALAQLDDDGILWIEAAKTLRAAIAEIEGETSRRLVQYDGGTMPSAAEIEGKV